MNDRPLEILAIRDLSGQRPIPSAWRPTLRAIAKSFISGDYALRAGIIGADPIHPDTASRIGKNIRSYGVALGPLPDQTWDSSTCIWYGDHWDALVDPWSADHVLDLVLHVQVKPSDLDYHFSVHLVYVP